MIKEIIREVRYIFILALIVGWGLVWGLMLAGIAEENAMWEAKYASWVYNLSPSEGTGWEDSIVSPTLQVTEIEHK